MGLVPGATLLTRVDIAMASWRANGRQRDAHASVIKLSLEYLVSYEKMGVARLTCTTGCSCAPQRINAHQVGDVRNVSIFAQYEFNVTRTLGELRGPGSTLAMTHDCELQLRILEQSSSGGHKFKVRSIIVSADS